MSITMNGRAAYTGADRRGTFAARRPHKPNTITHARRQFVFTRIDENALALIDATAEKWNISRGEAIARIVRMIRDCNTVIQSKGAAA